MRNDQNSNLPSFLSQIGPMLFLTGIFFFNSVSRVILSPLMPTIEEDLKVGHGEAGSLFLLITLGYCPALFASGFISSRLNHRRTIVLSSVALGVVLIAIGFNHYLWGIRFGLIALGMMAGLYLPSGIATITHMVGSKDWGKAVAIHELAPSLSFVAAPLLAEALLRRCPWWGILVLLGIATILAGVFFGFLGRGGVFLGEAPNTKTLRSILAQPSYWIIIILFTLSIGASMGIYSMLPLYLVSERGMEHTWANTLIGLSRVLSVGMPLLAGWMTDRLGITQTLKAIFLTNGLMTIMLGILPGEWIVLTVFLQPMIATCFFAPGFAAISRMSSSSLKNVAVSLTVPLSFFLGGGAIPAGLGVIGEAGSFSLGFILLGVLLLSGFVGVRYLKFAED